MLCVLLYLVNNVVLHLVNNVVLHLVNYIVNNVVLGKFATPDSAILRFPNRQLL